MKQLLLTALLLVTASGCEQARSFMQMDSNSGSPFLGLQLSVDARTPAGSEVTIADGRAASVGQTSESGVIQRVSSRDRSADFVPTAGTRVSTGNLKYSLPNLDLSQNPETAAEVEDILTRI